MDGHTDNEQCAALLYDLLFGYLKTEVLRVSVEMDVFGALSAGGATCEELAKKCDVPEIHLEKLLNTLCMVKLLKKKTAEQDVYENSETAAKYLVRSSPDSLRDLVPFFDMFKGATSKLNEAIKKGGQVLTEEDNIFVMSENADEFRRTFQAGMACVSKTSHLLVKAFDLGQYKSHVDVGGGTGTFARKVAEEYPDLEVSVCDLKRVVDTARSLPVNKDTRVNFIAGNFFEGDMPNADLYSLCHVLHDWNDEDCDVIMKNVYDHVNPGGAVLILDSVFYDDKVGPARVNLTEISQIIQHDGKHRTKAEFEQMLVKHGFSDVQLVRHDEFTFYEAIYAKKL